MEAAMTRSQLRRCHAIIHGASAAAGAAGGGLAQVPGADATIIAPIQIAMIVALGRIFEIRVARAAAKAAAYASLGTLLGKGISRFIIARIPVFGNIINAATAATVTESLGWGVAHQMDEGSFVN